MAYRIYPPAQDWIDRYTAECKAAGHEPVCAEHQAKIDEGIRRTQERLNSPEVDASTARFMLDNLRCDTCGKVGVMNHHPECPERLSTAEALYAWLLAEGPTGAAGHLGVDGCQAIIRWLSESRS